MKALFLAASLCFFFSGFLRGEQSGAPASRTEEIAQLRKQVVSLEERVDHLEKRLDRMSRPRVVPLARTGASKEFS